MKTLTEIIKEQGKISAPLDGVFGAIEESIRDTIQNALNKFDSEAEEKRREFVSELNQRVKDAEKYVNSLKPIKGDKGDTVVGPQGEQGIQGVRGKDGEDGAVGPKGEKGKSGKDGKDGSPDTGEGIIKKINSLPVTGSQIDPWHVKPDAKFTKQIHGGGDTIFMYDLSSFLDGSTKTFTIPRNTKVSLITSSSAPFFFRPTVDWTTSGVGNTILTFDSAIDAAVMLAQGQSIGVLYTV